MLQIVLALVAGAGAGAGPERGAIAGFVLGLMYDLGVGTPLGLIALVYALAGFVAGYVLTLTPTPQWWLAAIFTAIGAAVGETAVPVGKTLIGQDGWFTTRLLTIVPVVAVVRARAQPAARPARAMVHVRQAAEVEGDARNDRPRPIGRARPSRDPDRPDCRHGR